VSRDNREEAMSTGSSRSPTALVMASAPSAAPCHAGLHSLLGGEGCVRLQRVLLARAAAWAAEVAPGGAHVAFTPSDAGEEIAELVGQGLDVFAQEAAELGTGVAAASERVLAGHAGPLLVVGTDLPGLAPAHAAAALSDLREGCDVSFGPAAHGGCYLVGINEPQPSVFAGMQGEWRGSVALARSLAEASSGGLKVGLLPIERVLHTPADARAMLADPLAPADVREALRPAASEPPRS
jgi:glycosyltransferase A (GT-A) superfamily protein (DUF2064 family)